MTVEQLLAALSELDADLPSAHGGSRRRLNTLRDEVQAVLVKGGARYGAMESSAVRFLGALPGRVVHTGAPPAWLIE